MPKPSLFVLLLQLLDRCELDYNQTKAQYKNNLHKFAVYCRSEWHCKNTKDCKKHIQDYADNLEARGLSANTIHTYLAPVCKIYGLSMSSIKKPIRHSAENTRSRGTPEVDKRSDAQDSYSPRLAAFADVVGIRRDEYAHLCGRNFKQDESGYWCVEVEKGKGGKYQLQRIPEDKAAFVKAYFDAVGLNENVFSKEEMNNKIDLHAKRAEVAKREYRRYVELFQADPTARERVYQEICARWKKYYNWNRPGEDPTKKRHKWRAPPSKRSLDVPYSVRGKNRALAVKNGWDITYDRLALLAISIFHLSHWRTGVTVNNYILT